MKLLRDRPKGQAVPRRLDTHFPVRDLSGRPFKGDWKCALGSHARHFSGQDAVTPEVSGSCFRTGNTRGTTRTMIFSAAPLASYISRFMTLESRDLITPGSPPGAGIGVKPGRVFLKPGDKMCPGIEGLGVQQQTVYAWDPALMVG